MSCYNTVSRESGRAKIITICVYQVSVVRMIIVQYILTHWVNLWILYTCISNWSVPAYNQGVIYYSLLQCTVDIHSSNILHHVVCELVAIPGVFRVLHSKILHVFCFRAASDNTYGIFGWINAFLNSHQFHRWGIPRITPWVFLKGRHLDHCAGI